MPPRRRGKATTARAAAIEAVQRKKRDQTHTNDDDDDANTSANVDGEDVSDFEDDDDEDFHHHQQQKNHHNHHGSCSHSHNHNHHHHHHNTKANATKCGGRKRSYENNDDDGEEFESESDDGVGNDSPPPLVDNADEGDEDYCEGLDDDDEDDAAVGSAEGAGANSSSNTMSGEGGCLHCHKSASNADIQVRCDECQAYICQTCHWCHEFQANHEIRVCDRCDAFYCRTCDEMDQCDDCGEVVCASCSTLLSCKFCGGGLCEECATACGRCGIVLCSRDAKFAVDCDTCRLSYCLVCLASGSKDPCVRCGHRPSKRMEQLVHLRLKSIYKAFKQSSRNNKNGIGGEGGGDNDDDDDVDDDDDDDDYDDDHLDGGGKAGDPQSLLQAAASAASKHSGGGRSGSGSRHHSNHHHASMHHAASAAMAGNSKHSSAGSNAVSRDQQAKDMVDKYMAEKEKADAAAAALLAELEEEEVAVQSKKNKKQRKKEREKAKKDEELKQHQPPPERTKQQKESMDDNVDDDDSDIEIIDIAKISSTGKKGLKAAGKKKKKKNVKALVTTKHEVNNQNGDSSAMETENESLPVEAATLADKNEEGPKVDPIEQQLCEYVADSNYVGIEEILTTLKGVPGRAVLRKNAKKALKKIKAEQIAIEEEAAALLAAERAKKQAAEGEARRKESEKAAKELHARVTSGAGTPATHSETNSSSGRHPVPPPLPPNELLRVVSHTQGGTGVTQATSHRVPRGQTSSNVVASTAAKAECVMHLAYNVVGWVIGKGGQRIRDLMEESGAKVWIDQEHLSPTDPRIVYVSGNRKSVESAVKLIKELVSKAPGAPVVSAEATGGATVADMASTSQLPNALKTSQVGGSDIMHLAPSAEQKLGMALDHSSFEASNMAAVGVGQNSQASGAPVESLFLKTDDVGLLNQQALGHDQQHLSTTTNRADGFAQEISCEACFVPLLIGRRGWTIKHIQDSSGARVDIDQTVTPRKVKISGREENVQTAIRMVRDVLSYPHAQLQGTGDSLEGLEHPPGVLHSVGELNPAAPGMDPTVGHSLHLESAAATLSNTTTVAASNQILNPAVHPSPILTTKSAAVERVHTPPPSSHINISDAKSTISASSSLSSTPEPSMASTVKGHYGATGGTPGPLLPPEYGGAYAQLHPNLQSSNLFGQQSNLQQMNLPNLPDHRAGAVGGNLPPQQPPLFPNGMPQISSISPVSPRYNMSPGLQRGFSQQQQLHLQQQQRQHELLQQQQQQLTANVRQMNEPSGITQQGPPYQARPDGHSNLHHSSSMPFPTAVPRQQQLQSQMHLHQQSAFLQSDQKPLRHGSAPDIGMGHPGKSATFVPSGMWGEGTSGGGTGQSNRSNPADGFATGSMPLQGQQHGPDPRLNTSAPQQPLGFGLGVSGSSQDPRLSGGSAVPALKPQGKDDAQLIDSLFGPKDGGASKEKDNILTGFQGLSLDEGIRPDMWAKDMSKPWDPNPQVSSSLLGSIQPDVHHPSQSRFGWGEKEGGI